MTKQLAVIDPMGEEVAFAFSMTTSDQRQQVAHDWTEGEKTKCQQFADLLGVRHDGLLVASLLDAEHESICDPRGRPRSNRYGVLATMAKAYRPKVETCLEN